MTRPRRSHSVAKHQLGVRLTPEEFKRFSQLKQDNESWSELLRRACRCLEANEAPLETATIESISIGAVDSIAYLVQPNGKQKLRSKAKALFAHRWKGRQLQEYEAGRKIGRLVLGLLYHRGFDVSPETDESL